MQSVAGTAIAVTFVLVMALVIAAAELARPIMRARREVADEGGDAE